jgi:hypothetical protein
MLLPDLLVAYIDPISGSILLQTIVAAGVGALAFFRRSISGFVFLQGSCILDGRP